MYKMKVSIFYSWQSDSPSRTNRYFIENTIKSAIVNINKDNRVISYLDRDTKELMGSPNICDSVFNKINHSRFFICDISLISGNPNPNVLIELGYAIKVLGWNKIICLFNSLSGSVENLPFDINHNRVTVYNPDNKNEKARISSIITKNINSLFRNGKLYNPIEDHVKKKIDYIVINIIRNISNIFYFEKTVDYS